MYHVLGEFGLLRFGDGLGGVLDFLLGLAFAHLLSYKYIIFQILNEAYQEDK